MMISLWQWIGLLYLAETTSAFAMSRALINTSALYRHFAEPSQKTIVFTVTFLFDFHLWSICIFWIHIAPSLFATVCCYNIQVRFRPISHLRFFRIHRRTKTHVCNVREFFSLIWVTLRLKRKKKKKLTWSEIHMTLALDGLDILCLLHKSTWLLWYHNV